MPDARFGRHLRPIPTSLQSRAAAKSTSPVRRSTPHEERPRSKSFSPVKKSPTTHGLSSHLANEKESDNDAPTAAMSREQLMLLSETPLSDTLHFSRSGYAIPIPFKLQMPPKLAPPPSGDAKSSSNVLSGRPILIFNGTGYESMNCNASLHQGFKSASPGKPPSTVTNNKKVARFVQQNSFIPPDQLSLIEEKSVGGGSRVSSANAKTLPSLPDDEAGTDRLLSTGKTSPNRRSFHSLGLINKAGHQRGLMISRDESINKPQPPPRTVSSSLVDYENAFDLPEGSDIQSPQGKQPDTKIPPSATIRHNMCMAPSELKIGKRTFSDESCVSSVSSLSSIGDLLNFSHAYMLMPDENGEIRVTSDVMNYLETGKLSRHGSLKAPGPPRSITDHGDGQNFNSNTSHSVDSLPPPKRMERSERTSQSFSEPKIPEIPEHSQMTISHPTQMIPRQGAPKVNSPIEDGPIEPLVLHNKMIRSAENTHMSQESPSRVQSPSADYNNGAGTGFNFPNNSSNATNDDKARKRAHNQRAYRKSMSLSSHFSDGQIEIPEILEDIFHANKKTTVNDEALKVPPSAAAYRLKGHSGEASFDSDSEGSFNTQFQALQAKQASKSPSITDRKSHDELLATSNPLKNSHSRHRSMYNIDFGQNDILNVLHSKARPMSMNFDPSEIADISKRLDSLVLPDDKRINIQAAAAGPKFKTPIKINSSKLVVSPSRYTQAKPSQLSHKEEQLNIKVAEAPKKVRYPVDFKDKASKTQPPHGRRSSYFHEVSPKKYPVPRNYNSPLKSDVASSYNSSRTGQYTESTAPTDNGSVVIDLTKESYDICMVNRKDSTTSYKSVIENTSDGKKVEIVLVDEDDDAMNQSYERDDLLSIYSHYITGWDDLTFRQKDRFPESPSFRHRDHPTQILQQTSRLPLRNEVPKFNVKELLKTNLKQFDGSDRKNSNGSMESEKSEGLANSWMPSESNFRVKANHIQSAQCNERPERIISKAKGFSREPPSETEKVAVRQKAHEPAMVRHSNHFDYHANGNYDFNSFMLQTRN